MRDKAEARGILGVLILTMSLFLFGCDDEETAESGAPVGIFSIRRNRIIVQGDRIATQAGAGAIIPKGGIDTPPLVAATRLLGR